MKARLVSGRRILLFVVVVVCGAGAASCMRSCGSNSRGDLQFVTRDRAKQSSMQAGLVVVVHGWIEKGTGDWPQDMAAEIQKRVDANEWCCGYYDWRKQARTVNPSEAAEHGRDIAGPQLAEEIMRLGGEWRHIHLIGHSCGCWVVSEAAKILARATKADIHLTLLDAYVPAFWQESSLADVNTADANCWADHYYTRDYTLGWTQHNLTFAHNVDITSIDYGLKDHNFPWKWYYGTITGQYPESGFFGKHKVVSAVDGMEYGFARSREAAGAQGWQISRKLPMGEKAVKLKKNTSVAFSGPNIAILWEKDIARANRKIKPYTIKIEEDKDIIRVVGVSYIYAREESPRIQEPELFEYRFSLRDDNSELKTLMALDDGDISVILPDGGIKDARLIDNNIMMVRSRHKSFNFQELTIDSDWRVKTREIPGLTRLSVSTHGACRNMNGEVFLCGNSGYIRKVKSDGNVVWDTNYRSNKGEDGTFGVAFSESENMLVAFGFSFEPDTKFTTKDSSLWLASLDSKGEFKARTEFEGIANFGKTPSFCLSKSDNPIVIYDNNAEIGSYKIYVSKFSEDLNTKAWTTHIFDGNGMIIPRMSLTPLENDYTLAAFHTMTTDGINFGLHFYIVDNNGSVIDQAVFEDIRSCNYLVTALKDRIFLVTEGRRYQEDKDAEIARLTCFKITPCGMK